MPQVRYLCSCLATIKVDGVARPVLIEEIWAEGALLDCEEEIVSADFAELECGGPFFAGRLAQATQHEFGWRTEITFGAETQWSEKIFRPSHLLDLREVKGPENDETES